MTGFALQAAILEILFAISQRNSGLSPDIPFVRYLWSYGTTGILTLTAALWHRLDYETKVSAPWLRAHPITTSKSALLVDYIDAWSLLIPFRALRNRDYEVVYSSTVSLLLQVLIILSTSLFTLVPTSVVNDAEPVFLTSRFVDDPARLRGTESLLPYYITMGTELPTGNLSKFMNTHPTYPEGCTGQFAYQTFHPVSSSLETLETTVYGLALGLSCETASVAKRVMIPREVFGEDGEFSSVGDGPQFEVNYQGCQTTIYWEISESDIWNQKNETFRYHGMILSGVPGFARNQCNSTDQAARRLVFLSAEVEWRSYKENIIYEGNEAIEVKVDATVSQAIALVCTPSLEQTLLDVSRNSGGVQSLTRRSRNNTDFLSAIQPWDFIDFFLDTVENDTNNGTVGNATLWADTRCQSVLGFCGQSCLGEPELLNDKAVLQDILATFLASYAATTAHTMLTERANITSTGTSLSTVVRLWVQPMACQAMVALLALLILIILGFQFERKKNLTCKVNPGSIAATTILAGQVAFSNFPRYLGSANTEELHTALDAFLNGEESSSSYALQHSPPIVEGNSSRTSTEARPASSRSPVFRIPLPLRPISQTTLILVIVGCGTTLMVLLRKSANEHGLGDTANSKYLLFAWTTVPATILTMISWWLSSVDTQVRLLAPYHSLNRNKCSCSALRMDLLRGLIPLVLYQELKTTSYAAASTTLAALLGATLTTVSAAMFHVITYPVSSPVELSQDTVFITPVPRPIVVVNSTSNVNNTYISWIKEPSYIERSRLSSLILETNLSYSQESYQDLIFPTFRMAPLETDNALYTTNASSATITVTAPALRPGLSCRIYSPSDIAAFFVRNQSVPWSLDPVKGVVVNITSELCHSKWPDLDPTFGIATSFFETGSLSEALFAAVTWNRQRTISIAGCSGMLYIWGYHEASPGPITNISAVGCNSSLELVDVKFSLSWPDMSLDLVHAPEAIESTARAIRGHEVIDTFHSRDFYSGLASLPVVNESLFDSFFKQLVTSRYAIPVSAIGDPTQADIVMDAIRLQHGIIEAQFLSRNYRVNMNSSNATENATSVLHPTLFNTSTSGDSAEYSATMTCPFGSRRVVQDPTATAILEALLLSILILLILGWWFGSSEPSLPRSPSSVGSILALLAGGNILEHLYDGSPEPLSWDDVKRRLGEDTKFYLGWDPSNANEEVEQRRFGIWIAR